MTDRLHPGAHVGRAPGIARVGCSGWVYGAWRGAAYPPDLPQRRWFEHYAATFDTVEINATFYRLPTEQAVERRPLTSGPHLARVG